MIQRYLEDRRASFGRRVKIFRDLMANRASRISAPYVQALNGIETEFYGERKVIEAWRSLVNHLYTPQGEAGQAGFARWNDRLTELLNDMLYEMGESLDYHFDKVTLQRNVYYPSHWNTLETENTKLRQAAIKVFEGELPLKVEVASEVPVPVAPNAPPRVG